MIVAGAKGLAKELLEILHEDGAFTGLYFFDDVSGDCPEALFDRFAILRSMDAVRVMFGETGDPAFSLGLGNPVLRRKLCDKFEEAGGQLTSVISSKSHIGRFDVIIGRGCCILPGAVITAAVRLGRGCLINPNATISHDTILGDFVEVSPGVNVTGNCRIGDYSFLGAGSVILPKIKVGSNVVVGAGAVVTRDVPDNTLVVGVPAVAKKKFTPLNFDR